MAESVAGGVVWHLLRWAWGRWILRAIKRRALAEVRRWVRVGRVSMGIDTVPSVPRPYFKVEVENRQPAPARLTRAVLSVFVSGAFVGKHTWDRAEWEARNAILGRPYRDGEAKPLDECRDPEDRRDGRLTVHFPAPVHALALVDQGWEVAGFVELETAYGTFPLEVSAWLPAKKELDRDDIAATLAKIRALPPWPGANARG